MRDLTTKFNLIWSSFFLFALFSIALFYSTQIMAATQINSEQFDPIVANTQLENLRKELTAGAVEISALNAAVNQLLKLQNKAEICVDNGEKELQSLHIQHTVAKIEETPEKELTEEQRYLKNKLKSLEKRVSNCRFFVLRSQETIETFSNIIQQEETTLLLKRDPPIWENIANSPGILATVYAATDYRTFIERSGIEALTPVTLSIVVFMMLISLLIGFKIASLIKKGMPKLDPSILSERIYLSFLSVITRYLPYILPLLIIVVAFVVTEWGKLPSHLAVFVYGLSSYLLFIMVMKFLFHPPKPAIGLSDIPENIARSLINRLQIFGLFLFVALLGYQGLSAVTLPDAVVQLAITTFMILLSFNLIGIIWLVNKLPKLKFKYSGLRIFISVILVFGLFTILTSESFGFHNLAKHILYAVVATLVFSVLTWFLLKILTAMINSLLEEKHSWQKRFHELIGLRPYDNLPELLWLRLTLYIVAWSMLGITLLKMWGLSEANYRRLLDALIDGFQIVNITIVPSRIVLSLLFLVVVMMLTRLLRAYVLSSFKVTRDRGGQEALSTIVGYIGFGVAVVVALLIAGVNFTGIAIIAGALSVGIGFGLQNIVSNFVSGLILLLERPIKIGDRILVGGTEGVVRSISIRSTRIHTMQRTDVLVPNSDIIARQVTNLMFRDFNFRIEIKVGVAYGSDTELVRETMMNVAKEHPEVITDDEPRQPRVLFRSFGESTLDFELWCIIKNVNSFNNVMSDLHFAIDKAFREVGIEIAFPQRDLHIRSVSPEVTALRGAK